MASHASLGSDAPAPRVSAAVCTSASLHIRSATQDAHEALERTAVVRRLMSPHLSPGDYLQVLDAWLGVWAPLEDLLVHRYPYGLDASHMPTLRVGKLRQDVSDLRVALGKGAAAAGLLAWAADAGRLSEFRDLASDRSGWLGLAYVLQGSMLGGAVVAAHLQRVLPQEVTHCTRFFNPHPPAPCGLANDWRLWLQWFDGQLATPCEQRQASHAAVRVFKFLACAWTARAQ